VRSFHARAVSTWSNPTLLFHSALPLTPAPSALPPYHSHLSTTIGSRGGRIRRNTTHVAM
jgi:hypothetical protein